jgi:hypothetical protein
MVRKGNPKNIQAIDDVCGVRAAAGLGKVREAMFRGLSDKCVPAAGNQAEAETVSFLALLQERGRLVDFLMEDITTYDNAQVGAAARESVAHPTAGCRG